MATALDPFFYFHPDDNVAPNGAPSTGGTEDPAYPLANATDLSFKNLANPFKVTGTTGDLRLDFGGAVDIVGVVIWHNLNEDVPYSVQRHASDSWGSPTIDIADTAPAKRADGHTTKRFHDLRDEAGYSSSGLRWLRVSAAGNDVPVGLKVMAFSRVRQLTQDFQWGVQDDENHIGIRMKTDAGVPWNYDLSSAPRVLRGSALLTDANAEAVREWFRACGGGTRPTVVIKEPTINDAWLGFISPGTFSITAPSLSVDRLTHDRQYVDANVTQIAIEEITAGDPEWY